MKSLIRILTLSLVMHLQSAYSAEKISSEKILEILPQFEELIKKGMKESLAPGLSVSIVHNGQIVYMKGFGVREVDQSELVNEDTVFQIASVSKSITSTIIARLVGEGKVDWDSRIENLDPGFRLSDPWISAHVTIRDLLCHRSGLPSHAGDLLEDFHFDRKTILHRLRYIDQLLSFRADYAYTNYGYSEAGYACANHLHTNWYDLAKNTLYEPLGMFSTSSAYEDYIAANNRAVNHIILNGKMIPHDEYNPNSQSPAGGVSSSAKDMAQWMILQLSKGEYKGKQLIDSKALQVTHVPQMIAGVNEFTGEHFFYGLGWNITKGLQGRTFINHSGGFASGVRSQTSLLPDENLGITILTNSSPQGLPEGLSQSFFNLILTGELQEDWIRKSNEFWTQVIGVTQAFIKPADYTPSLPYNVYSGKYQNKFFGEIVIKEEKNQLQLTIGHEPTIFPLKHLTRDIFVFETRGENTVGETLVRFIMDEDNIVRQVVIDYLNEYGMGVFDGQEIQ